jgi:hypothetical protein
MLLGMHAWSLVSDNRVGRTAASLKLNFVLIIYEVGKSHKG